MEQWQTQLTNMSQQDLAEELTRLEVQLPIVRSRAKVIGTPAEAVVIGELNYELARIQKEYASITTTAHTSIVATMLAKLQGKEEQVKWMLGGWKYAQEADRTLDTRINFCKKLITERRANEEDRRMR